MCELVPFANWQFNPELIWLTMGHSWHFGTIQKKRRGRWSILRCAEGVGLCEAGCIAGEIVGMIHSLRGKHVLVSVHSHSSAMSMACIISERQCRVRTFIP